MTMTDESPLDEARRLGAWWARVLDCTVRPERAVVFRATVGNGVPSGPPLGAPIFSPGDPLWAPKRYEDPGGGVDGESPGWRYIGELDPSHRRNLYEFLCRRAGGIAWRWVWAGSMADPFGGDGGGNLDDARSEAEDWVEEHPLEWLLSTRFMWALGALLIGDGHRATVELWADVAAGRREAPVRRPRGLVGDLPDWLAS